MSTYTISYDRIESKLINYKQDVKTSTYLFTTWTIKIIPSEIMKFSATAIQFLTDHMTNMIFGKIDVIFYSRKSGCQYS